MAVGIVVVSHSAALAEAAVELALQMVHDAPPPIALAAGTIDGGIGTDATAVTSAIAEVDQGDGVVVFVDMGSAMISAEMGVELYDHADADVRVLAAPFVEGLMAGVIKTAGGAPIDEVAAEATAAMQPKLGHLGAPDAAGPADGAAGPADSAASAEAPARAEVALTNEAGLHARPAALFVSRAKGFDAEVTVRKGDAGPVSASSSIGLATLDARQGDALTIEATGPDADQAVAALAQLVESGFADS